jgi:hypothetical protein
VRADCAEYSLAGGEMVVGIWGGMTGRERRRARAAGAARQARTCDECGAQFTGRHRDTQYCSPRCSQRARARRRPGTEYDDAPAQLPPLRTIAARLRELEARGTFTGVAAAEGPGTVDPTATPVQPLVRTSP